MNKNERADFDSIVEAILNDPDFVHEIGGEWFFDRASVEISGNKIDEFCISIWRESDGNYDNFTIEEAFGIWRAIVVGEIVEPF